MSKLVDRLLNKAIKILIHYKDKQEVNSYIAGIQNSYHKLSVKKELTTEQKKEIQDYYTKWLGYPIPLEWHQYFTSRTGVYSKLYFPTSEYKTSIVGRLNVYPLKRAYTDKNVTDLILPNARQPRIVLKNMNGYFYFDGNAVSKEEAIQRCYDIGEMILKPSLTGRGKGVKRICIHNGQDTDGQSLASIFSEYQSDFLIEDLVHQHKDMAALNDSSVNTIRILTYRNGMDVYVLYTVVRIGRKGQAIDNESAGGISARINPDGRLAKYAYGAPGVDKVEYTDSGVLLEGYMIPSYEKAISFVKEQHLYLPFFNLIAWDIAIEEDGEPIMIEFNMTPDLSQSAYGPAFGDYTEMILKDAMSKKNTYSEVEKTLMWKKH